MGNEQGLKSGFFQRLKNLVEMKEKCLGIAAMARNFEHPDNPERIYGFKNRHNLIATRFNREKFFWMKRISLLN